jgi:hypothetical protein
MLWGPFALVLGAFGIIACATVVGIPLGIPALLLAGFPIAMPIIKYNQKMVAYNMAGGAQADATRKEFGHTVKPWDVSVTYEDTTAYEGWYHGGANQAGARDGEHLGRGRRSR